MTFLEYLGQTSLFDNSKTLYLQDQIFITLHEKRLAVIDLWGDAGAQAKQGVIVTILNKDRGEVTSKIFYFCDYIMFKGKKVVEVIDGHTAMTFCLQDGTQEAFALRNMPDAPIRDLVWAITCYADLFE